MSLQQVQAFFDRHAPDLVILVAPVSTATVTEAAAGFAVAPGCIAKTLGLRLPDRVLLLVASGDARLDNRKLKAAFGGKAKMLDAAEVEALTGHPVGGVCPFGLATDLPVYCDVSLRAFDEILPAAGARNSAVRIAPDRLADLTAAIWVDVCS